MTSPKRTGGLAAVLLLAGAVATTGAAALLGNSASYADAAGDAASAPDISSVAVANDDPGNLSFRITIANRSALAAEDRVVLHLDVDGTEDEEGHLNSDYAIAYDPDGAHFVELTGDEPRELPAALLTGFGGSFTGGVLSLRVNQRYLADTSLLNFWLGAGTELDDSRDDAPDGEGVWEYRVVSPSMYVLSFSRPQAARAGATVRATMSVRGARRGTSKVTCTATVAGTRLKGRADWFTISVVDGSSGTSRTLSADPRCTWAVPKSAKGKLLRARVAVAQGGLQVARSFSVRVR
jgi:hypothetical protein